MKWPAAGFDKGAVSLAWTSSTMSLPTSVTNVPVSIVTPPATFGVVVSMAQAAHCGPNDMHKVGTAVTKYMDSVAVWRDAAAD